MPITSPTITAFIPGVANVCVYFAHTQTHTRFVKPSTPAGAAGKWRTKKGNAIVNRMQSTGSVNRTQTNGGSRSFVS